MIRELTLVMIFVVFMGNLISTLGIQRVKSQEPPTTIIVPDDYPTIQEAINNAAPGNTIFVRAGTYYESIVVNKTVSLIGENKNTTTIDGNATGSVVIVTADHVTISGFTIQRGGALYPDLGDCLILDSNDNAILQNILRNSAAGIYLPGCHGNIISQNIITNTNLYGIRVFRSASNKIIENNIAHAYLFGIFVVRSSESELRKNFLVNTSGGIYMGYCSNNNITENVISNSTSGITLEVSSNNNVKRNNMSDIRSMGLILGPEFGPFEAGTDGNVLVENNVVNNHMGIRTILCNNNLICRNNFINNTSQFYSHLSTNIWDDGYPSGGNYWSDYTGVDLDPDGIGDTEYMIDSDNVDHYPLMGMFHSFNTSLSCSVDVVSNSTIESFEYSEPNRTIRMYVSNMTTNQTFGFCRVRIPHRLMNETYHVTINGAKPYYWHYTLYDDDDGNNGWIYFNYQHSKLEILITPEFPSFLIQPLLMIATLLAVIAYRRKYFSIET